MILEENDLFGNYKQLACAVVLQAVEDYEWLAKQYKKGKYNPYPLYDGMRDIVKFAFSKRFEQFDVINRECYLRRLNELQDFETMRKELEKKAKGKKSCNLCVHGYKSLFGDWCCDQKEGRRIETKRTTPDGTCEKFKCKYDFRKINMGAEDGT